MKTLITALAATMLLGGIATANAADQQATGAERDYALSREVAGPSAFGSAYASARESGRNVIVTNHRDFQLEGR